MDSNGDVGDWTSPDWPIYEDGVGIVYDFRVDGPRQRQGYVDVW